MLICLIHMNLCQQLVISMVGWHVAPDFNSFILSSDSYSHRHAYFQYVV